MQYTIHNQASNINPSELRNAYTEILNRYDSALQFALTLTLKQYAKISIKEQGSDYCPTVIRALDEDTLTSTIRYFTANLTQLLYGNAAKHKNKQHYAKPLLFFAVEGLNTGHKLTHLHAALGNVPEHKKDQIDVLVRNAWARCDFANKHVHIQPYYSTGWNSYITKEIGLSNNDALSIVHSTIPAIFQN